MSKQKGLWDRVHAKRNRGESPAKPGDKNYPKTLNVEDVNQRYCPKCQKNELREECKYGTAFWDMFSLPAALNQNSTKYNIAIVHPANEEVDLEEKTLTSGEKKKREDYVKGMKKSKGDFEKRYGDKAKEVMYATATKMAKEEKESSIVIETARRLRNKSNNVEEAAFLAPILGRIAGVAVGKAVGSKVAGSAAQGSLRAMVGQKAGEIAASETEKKVKKKLGKDSEVKEGKAFSSFMNEHNDSTENLSESVNIAGDFTGNLYINGTEQESESVRESFTADIVWQGSIHRLELVSEAIPSKQQLTEQLQNKYPGAIVHNIYPTEENDVTIKSSKRYHPGKLEWL